MGRTDYDAYGDRYEADLDRAVRFSGRSHKFFAQAKADELVRLAQRHLDDAAYADALDVGCGVGLTDRFLHGMFRSVTGVDVSPGVLERAARTNPWARYHIYGGTTLPFDAGTFDLTFAVCVVQVLQPSERLGFLAELRRVTRRGGLVVVFEHNPLNPLTRLAVRRCTFGHDAEMLSADELGHLFASAGLAVTERRFILLFPTRRTPLRELEHALGRLPLGAQYYLAGREAGIADGTAASAAA